MSTIKIAAALALAVLLPATALAQQRTIYGADGKVTGRVATDSQGSVFVGRTSTNSQGKTTIYDVNGRKTGSVTTNRSK